MSGNRIALMTGYAAAGLATVPIPAGSKGPNTTAWNQPENALTTPEAVRAYAEREPRGGVGLLHSLSGTCALDVDHLPWATLAFQEVGVDLPALTASNPYRIRGKRGEKPVWRVPDGLSLKPVKLCWPDPERRDLRGCPVMVTVFELRAGPVQDVLPPSIHPDTGRPYEWVGPVPESRIDLPELPAVLLRIWEGW